MFAANAQAPGQRYGGKAAIGLRTRWKERQKQSGREQKGLVREILERERVYI